MKILMLLDNEFPPDIRVENEIDSLTAKNHFIHILSYNFGKKSKIETFPNIKVQRIKIHKQIAKKSIALIHLIPIYKLIWWIHVMKILKDEHFDAVHIHDLPLCFLIKSIKKRWKIKVVADMHENYPYLIKEQRYMKFFISRLILNIKIWHKKETEWLSHADTIICIADEMKKRLSLKLGQKAKLIIVPNTVNLNIFNNLLNIQPKLINKFNNNFNLLYIGGFDPIRGLEYLIEATGRLKNDIPNIKTILVGNGNMENELREKSNSLGLNTFIEFEGWQPFNKIKSYIEIADICVIPHIRSPQTDNSSPNKLFQYMYFKKPVLASNCISVEKIIIKEKCGLIFNDKDSYSLAKQIKKLYNNPLMRKTMGENGFLAVKTKYNWNTTVEPLLQTYE